MRTYGAGAFFPILEKGGAVGGRWKASFDGSECDVRKRVWIEHGLQGRSNVGSGGKLSIPLQPFSGPLDMSIRLGTLFAYLESVNLQL